MIPLDREIEHARQTNPEFRRIWDATEFARAVSITVLRYRTERGLTQAQFGELTGLTQPQVARLESGEECAGAKSLTCW
jgi:predicted XRE-type DNA-binding protein